MEGRYTFIIADLSHLAGQTYQMSLCALGIMGTKYVRDSPVVETIEILQGETAQIDVLKIYSQISIGTLLDIDLRLGDVNQASFVTFQETETSTIVQINTQNEQAGTTF